MRDDGIDPSELHVRYGADLRYTNQSYEIAVPLRSEEIGEATLPDLAADFQAMYLKMYGHTNKTPIEVVNLRVVTYKPVHVRGGLRTRQLEGVEQAPESEKEVWFLGTDRPLRTRTYRRERLSAGSKVEGPAIIEQADTTVLVYPDQTALVDASNNLRIGGVSKAYSL